jgi:hypothetical protein
VRLDVSKGIRRLTAARFVVDAHESAVWGLATELQRQHTSSRSSAPWLLLAAEQDLGGFISSPSSASLPCVRSLRRPENIFPTNVSLMSS